MNKDVYIFVNPWSRGTAAPCRGQSGHVPRLQEILVSWLPPDRRFSVFPNNCERCRDGHETFQAETETRPETHRSETRNETETLGILSETRPRRDVEGPRRDRDRDVPDTETLAETCGFENH